MNIVGFTGTRDVITPVQKEAFIKLIKSLNMQEFHHGDCTGWDKSAHDIIKGLQLPHHVKIVIHPPNYNGYRAYCKGDVALKTKPYLDRNRDIVNDSDLLVACVPGKEKLRSGTWSTIRYARKQNKSIYVVHPDGKIKTENL